MLQKKAEKKGGRKLFARKGHIVIKEHTEGNNKNKLIIKYIWILMVNHCMSRLQREVLDK